ncbi:MAG: hypothetical protein KMY54_01585 [Erysipelothrix sp.]|nr:hypothetical protein [Erysipelothrix sp.]
MLYKYNKDGIEALPYSDFSHLKGIEKDLEDLLVKHLSDLYTMNGQLMPIFQERKLQEEPDICALDKDGNLIIFELKRGTVSEETTNQIMRYSQIFGRKIYHELNKMYKTFSNDKLDLIDAHKEAFQLAQSIREDEFNRKQKLIIVGSSSDNSLMGAVEYWKSKGLDIDFLPYRFYEIGDEIYFEFFAKPYDYHINPREKKGILFDTNKSYDENSVWDMFQNSKVSAYGDASRFIRSFNKGDYVLYYHVGWGVIGAGKIADGKVHSNSKDEELYSKVNLLTPQIKNKNEIRYVSASELVSLLGKNFYFASTVKKPYLTIEESQKVVDLLIEKYRE